MCKRILAVLCMATIIFTAGCSSGSNDKETENSVSRKDEQTIIATFPDYSTDYLNEPIPKKSESETQSEVPPESSEVPESKAEPIVKSIVIKGETYSTDETGLTINRGNLTDTDIEPLKHMVNLTYLSLNNNQIISIKPLKGLTNLTRLDLSDNRIEDISAIKGMTELQNLNLSSNKIKDISYLSGLTNLEILNLNINKVSNVKPLYGLDTLTSVRLSSNIVSDSKIADLRAELPKCDVSLY